MQGENLSRVKRKNLGAPNQMSEYPRYERKMNPMLGSEASMDEALLFGEIDMRSLSAASRRRLEEYDVKLSQANLEENSHNLPPKKESELLAEGYKAVEEITKDNPSLRSARPAMSALKREVMRRLDLSPEEGENLSAHTLIGTPLHERLGFTGVFKMMHKGRRIYMPFEHLRPRREKKGVAPVYLEPLPDPSEGESYHSAIREAADLIGRKIELEKRRIDKGLYIPHRRVW